MEFLKEQAGNDQNFLWLPVGMEGMGICNSVKTDGRNLLLSYFLGFVLFLALLVSNKPAFQGFT